MIYNSNYTIQHDHNNNHCVLIDFACKQRLPASDSTLFSCCGLSHRVGDETVCPVCMLLSHGLLRSSRFK